MLEMLYHSYRCFSLMCSGFLIKHLYNRFIFAASPEIHDLQMNIQHAGSNNLCET